MTTATHILVLGGTAEARTLASALSGDPDRRVASSLAGRVAHPRLPVGEVRVGGFGGATGLTRWVESHDVDLVIDATHPFASTITAHAAEMSRLCNVPLTVLRRPSWTAEPGDRWSPVDDIAGAAEALPHGSTALLTIGRLGVHRFAHRDDVDFTIRCIDPPDAPLPPRARVILARGPFALENERELLSRSGIDVMVSKNSGGAATQAKLTAAREAGIEVVMIDRPPLPVSGLDVVTTVEECLDRVHRLGR